ncbi:MAG: DUF4348 domain-containing protein [Bacteroidaceae bacterium]|nr:DUF4348 domain-containing protein [Bacteroidaceae bacterium]
MKGKTALMALVVVCCTSVLCLLGCQGRASMSTALETPNTADSLDEDALVESEDTFALDDQTTDEPLPIIVDELFDDFVFRFDLSARLQRARVRFPLVVSQANGETQTIERRDWRHHALFLGQDFCTVLWNTRSQMPLSQDTTVCEARVEQIYLHSRTINVYAFERDSTDGLWMLTQMADLPFEHSDLQDFLDFYRQFATDSTYQRQHIREPLRYTTIDEDSEYETIEGTIDADQWFEFAPELPQDVLTNVNYGQNYPNPNRMVLQMRGLANGLQTLMIFHRNVSGQWQLTDYEN